jgi:site-specific DNA-methyltransferase (adenine-specific)
MGDSLGHTDRNMQLIQGDCKEVLPTLTGIDAIVGDPPYGIAKLNKFGSRNKATTAMAYLPIVGDDKPFDPAHLLDYPSVSLWGANWYANRLPASGGWLIWDKKDGGTSDNFSDAEMAWTNARKTIRVFHHKWRGMIRASEKNIPRLHSTQKPIAVMKWNIEQLGLKPGATICDPYMGSGTTGIAALELGYNFIGIEIDEGYFKIAKERIDGRI